MQSFEFFSPTHIFFGEDKQQAFVQATASRAKKILLITGGGSVERLGYLEPLRSALESAGCQVQHESGIEPNPLASTINAVAQKTRGFGAEALLALGGGSVMDAAKAIGFLLKSGETDIWPFVGGEKRFGEISVSLPLFCVPTTAATASEVTPYAVISNSQTSGKSHIGHDCFKPVASWINPSFTTKLPLVTTRDGAADILSHVFENYLLGGDDALLTDRYCESIMRTVIETLPKIEVNPADRSARAALLWCSTLALNGLQVCGRQPAPFVLHAIEHALSGLRHELAHGRGLATLFPAYFRWLQSKGRALKRLERLSASIFDGAPRAEEFIELFSQWLKDHKMLQSLQDLGFCEQDFGRVAKEVIRIHGGNEGTIDALGPMAEKEIVEILALTTRQV
jgi:alcohol dehydrogenase YqhD (iron-dependent ADH family)